MASEAVPTRQVVEFYAYIMMFMWKLSGRVVKALVKEESLPMVANFYPTVVGQFLYAIRYGEERFSNIFR